jgi:hypothetical protein
MLTDWETENGVKRRKLESVAVEVSKVVLSGRMY